MVQVGNPKNIEGCFFFLKILFSYLACSQILAKSSYGWSPLWLHHKIDKQKHWLQIRYIMMIIHNQDV
jgi:hypothetical protein